MRRTANRTGDYASLAFVVVLLVAVTTLPADTSLSEVRKDGVLRACVPTDYPPLVTGDETKPGYEIELLQAVADGIGVRLQLNVNPSIGRDFNPRSWRLTRAQCQVIAGGVAATEMTRSFLDTTPPHLETGWVLIAKGAIPTSLSGMRVGFFAGMTGRDRLAISKVFRDQGAKPAILASAEDVVAAMRNGRIDAAVTESLAGGQIARANGWTAVWLFPGAVHDPVAFGLWKGDLTLKRKIVGILDRLSREGTTSHLAEKYGIVPIRDAFAGGTS